MFGWLIKDRRRQLCAYRHMHELSQWLSRPRGPEHYNCWESQLKMFMGSGDNKRLRYINVDKAYEFIKYINGVT